VLVNKVFLGLKRNQTAIQTYVYALSGKLLTHDVMACGLDHWKITYQKRIR